MSMHYQEADPILVGSGELYIGKVNNPESATEQVIETALKNIGAIQAGATLTYSNQMQDIYSANRGLLMRFMTSQKIEFSCGIMTWVMDNMELLCPGTVEDITDEMPRGKKIKIGKAAELPINYLRFVHEKSDGSGDLIINIYKATPEGGFELTFDRENPLSVDYKFVALATDSGNLCEIIETFAPEVESLAVKETTGPKYTVTLANEPVAGSLKVYASADGSAKGSELEAAESVDEGKYKLTDKVIEVHAENKDKYLICEYYTS